MARDEKLTSNPIQRSTRNSDEVIWGAVDITLIICYTPDTPCFVESIASAYTVYCLVLYIYTVYN